MWTRPPRIAPPRRAGVTLVELVVAIVIVGISLAGLAVVLARTSTASVDPMITQQKVAIAESLMGEILLRPFAEDTAAVTAGVRATFNDVGDFNNYSTTGVRDADNVAVTGLGDYTVAVRVAPVALGAGANAVPIANAANLYANDALQVTVTVGRTGERAADAFSLSGWRVR